MKIVDKRNKHKAIDHYEVGQMIESVNGFYLVVELYNQKYALIDVKSGAAVGECVNTLTELRVHFSDPGDRVVNAKLIIEEDNEDE